MQAAQPPVEQLSHQQPSLQCLVELRTPEELPPSGLHPQKAQKTTNKQTKLTT
jgi:hypothetical protein